MVVSHGLLSTLADPLALLSIVAQLLDDGNATLAIVSWRVAAHISRTRLAEAMTSAHASVQLAAAGEVHAEGTRTSAVVAARTK